MILHDPYAIHRHWWAELIDEPEWQPDDTSRDWTDWDFILADVYQVICDFTGDYGQWLPDDTSGDVWWDVKSKFSGYEEALEKAREERGELKPGETLYAEPVYDESKPKPTLESMFADMESGVDDRRPSERTGARPPTSAELEALRAARGAVE